MCSITHGVLFLKCNLNRKKTAMLFTEDFWERTEYAKTTYIIHTDKKCKLCRVPKSVQFALP